MRIGKLILLLLSVVIIGTQTGCTNHNELGNISIVTGFFLDRTHENFTLIADCTNFGEEDSKETSKTKPIRVTAPSLREAFFKLESQSESPLCYSRAKVLLLGNNVLNQSKETVFNELFSLQVLASDIAVLQADFSENKIIGDNYQPFGLQLDKQLHKNKNVPNNKLYQLIKNSEEIHDIPTVYHSENGFSIHFTKP